MASNFPHLLYFHTRHVAPEMMLEGQYSVIVRSKMPLTSLLHLVRWNWERAGISAVKVFNRQCFCLAGLSWIYDGMVRLSEGTCPHSIFFFYCSQWEASLCSSRQLPACFSSVGREENMNFLEKRWCHFSCLLFSHQFYIRWANLSPIAPLIKTMEERLVLIVSVCQT